MSNRSDYLRKYYQEHKATLQTYYKDKYEKEKKERLTKAKKYYTLNRMAILIKAKFRDTTKKGHAHAIWKSIKKYAKQWKVSIVEWPEFRDWAMVDEGYEAVYQQWKETNFDRTYGPVVIRGVKKNGFIIENLKWDYRNQYSWWSAELIQLQQVEKNLDEQQKKRNKGSAEWRKKVKEEWNAKRKKNP